jgi:hypothetical protein
MKRVGFLLLGLLVAASSPLSWAGIGRVGNSSIGSDQEDFVTLAEKSATY